MVQQPPGGGMQPPPPPGMPTPGARPPMRMDTSSLPIADIVVAAGAFLTFIMSLFGWYKVKGFGYTSGAGKGGPENLILALSIILFLVAAFFIANKMFNLINLKLPVGLIYLVWGGLIELLVVIAIVWKPSLGFGGGFGISIGMAWVTWIIALVFGAITVVGGFLKVQES